MCNYVVAITKKIQNGIKAFVKNSTLGLIAPKLTVVLVLLKGPTSTIDKHARKR